MKIFKVVHRYTYFPHRREHRLLAMKADTQETIVATVEAMRREANQNQGHSFHISEIRPLVGHSIYFLDVIPQYQEPKRIIKHTKEKVDTFLCELWYAEGTSTLLHIYLVVAKTLTEVRELLMRDLGFPMNQFTIHPIKLEGLAPLYHWWTPPYLE